MKVHQGKPMRWRGLCLGVVLAWAAGFAVPTANPAAFLHLDGIPGESTDPAHENWIEIESVQQTLSRPAASLPAAAGRRSGEVVRGDVVVVKHLDKSSPKLVEALATGRVIPEARIELVRTDGNRPGYFQIVLQRVQVTARSTGARPAESLGDHEEIALSYEAAEWVYTEFAEDGTPIADHRAFWDFLRHRGGSQIAKRAIQMRAVVKPGQGIGIAWTAREGVRYQLLRGASMHGPFERVRSIEPAPAGDRWIELPAGQRFEFFLLQEID